jgi:hypothetical protein
MDELIAACLAILNNAEPKRESEAKTVPTVLLDRLSEALIVVGA